MSDPVRDLDGRFGDGNPYRFSPGQTGNPCGQPKGASFSAALGRQALAPVADREEMTKIARTIGLDPDEARNINVVARCFTLCCLVHSCVRGCAPCTGDANDDGHGEINAFDIEPFWN